MPTIVLPEDGHSGGGRGGFFGSRDFNYKYPNGLNLRPDSELHKKLLSRLMRLANASHRAIKSRHKAWNDIDKTMTVYIPVSDAEKLVKKKDPNKPISIVVPHSYAVLETILAYLTKAFLSDIIFSYDGMAPEDTVPAKLLEIAVNQQVKRFKSELALHTAFRDGLMYGLHASTVVWEEKWGKKARVKSTQNFTTLGSPQGVTRQKVNERALLYEGNRIINIDPYRYLPDPMVGIQNVQDGEFCGWIEEIPLNKLLAEELSSDNVFNVKYLKAEGNASRTSRFSLDASKRDRDRIKDSFNRPGSSIRYITAVNMYVNLIPKDWGLPGTDEGNRQGNYPEKWLFTMADDRFIITASPTNLNHNMFPVAINAPDFDGYSISPVSRIEMTHGLQEVLNWEFNSHIANIRKAINDMFVVDPSLINLNDLQNPEPGKLIRLRRSAWGRGVDGAVKQFNVHDVTSGNINDAGFIMNLMQKTSGAVDSNMGVMRQGGERRSAAEFNGTRSSALSRLEHLARITSLQYLQDVAYFHASHTQQLMSEDIFAKSVGTWPEVLQQEFGAAGTRVSPFDIIADFDVVFKDGTMIDSDKSALQFWSQSFQAMATNPALVQTFDMVRIFKHMARISGAKNVNDFILQNRVNPALMDSGKAQDQASKGNIVPINQLQGR